MPRTPSLPATAASRPPSYSAWREVPCVRIETMTPGEKRAYVIADNKLALNAGWDEEILAEELKALLACRPRLRVGVTGFSIAEIDSLIEGLEPRGAGRSRRGRRPDRRLRPRCRARATSGSLVLIG